MLTLLCATLCSWTLCGCGGGAQPRTAGPADADTLWQRAESDRIADRHESAAGWYSEFARWYPSDPRTPEALLGAGTAYRRAELPDLARAHLTAAGDQKDPAVTAQAWLQLGYLERAEGQYAESAMRFQEAARSAELPETRAEALLEGGISLRKAGAFEEARRPLTACAELAEVAPRHAAEAREVLAADPFFTIQVGAFVDPAHAAELARSLVEAGFDAEVRPGRSGVQEVHRVVSGRFARRPEAVRHAEALRTRFGGDPIIRP